MDEKCYYVYIMTDPANQILYTGMTSDISRRVTEHKQKLVEGFTKKYNCTKLVYVEVHQAAFDAITREKQIKAGSRKKKIALVMKENLAWEDISYKL